jgi:hypothetical protein
MRNSRHLLFKSGRQSSVAGVNLKLKIRSLVKIKAVHVLTATEHVMLPPTAFFMQGTSRLRRERDSTKKERQRERLNGIKFSARTVSQAAHSAAEPIHTPTRLELSTLPKYLSVDPMMRFWNLRRPSKHPLLQTPVATQKKTP